MDRTDSLREWIYMQGIEPVVFAVFVDEIGSYTLANVLCLLMIKQD
jgi:hypothetical protein